LAAFARVAVRKISIGLGPRIVTRGRFELKLIPFTSYVVFAGMNPYETEEERSQPLPEGRVRWTEASRARRVVLVLAWRIATFAIVFLLLGPSRAPLSFGRGIVQVAGGAIAPFARGAPLVHGAVNVAIREGLVVFFAVVLAKFLAISLLGLPTE